MTRAPRRVVLLFSLVTVFASCSSSSGGSGSPGAGGAGSNVGGSSAAGGRGGNVSASGGSPGASGGTAGGGTGGSSGSGGAMPGSGGVTPSGGSGGVGSAGSGGRDGAAPGTGGTDAASSMDAADTNAVACPTANEEKFSFFLISNKALIRIGGADATGMFSKLGGNLGGIEGADSICQKAAEFVSPCQKNKVWRAFLSTTTVNAIERIGTGPWADRNGRRWASSLATLGMDRPSDADPAIKNDPPNEEGVPNHNPDGTGQVDNHEILTGTGTNGRVYQQGAATAGGGSTQCGRDVGGAAAAWSAERATCWNWTRNTLEGCPRVGRSWCSNASCTPPGSGSGTNWMSVWNEGGCAPGGTLAQTGGLDGSRRVGSAGGYGGFFCFAVMPTP